MINRINSLRNRVDNVGKTSRNYNQGDELRYHIKALKKCVLSACSILLEMAQEIEKLKEEK